MNTQKERNNFQQMYLKKEYEHTNFLVLDQKRLFLSYILEKDIFKDFLSYDENFTLKTIIFDFCMQMRWISSCLENWNQLSASVLIRPLLETLLNIEIIFDEKDKTKERLKKYYMFLSVCYYDFNKKDNTDTTDLEKDFLRIFGVKLSELYKLYKNGNNIKNRYYDIYKDLNWNPVSTKKLIESFLNKYKTWDHSKIYNFYSKFIHPNIFSNWHRQDIDFWKDSLYTTVNYNSIIIDVLWLFFWFLQKIFESFDIKEYNFIFEDIQ